VVRARCCCKNYNIFMIAVVVNFEMGVR